MKFFKSNIAIVMLFAIGSINAKQVGSQPTAPKAAIQPTPAKPIYTPAPISNAPTFNLAKFKCISASVLLKYTQNNQEFVILTREARGNPQEQGGKRFTYDDCSGACEADDNYDPLMSAAREFWEEGNLLQTLGWSLEDTIKFVQNNTSEIIVYTKDQDKNIPGSRDIKNVTYIVNFDKYANKLFDNFYTAREKEKARYKKLGKTPEQIEKQVTLEKDKIAAVLWDDFKEAISLQRIKAEPVKVQARVRDEKAKKFHAEEIVFRPFLAIKLRPYFLNLPYDQGENSKIRYYHR